MTFFESILTTFEASLNFRGSWGSCGNQVKLAQIRKTHCSNEQAALKIVTHIRSDQKWHKINHLDTFNKMNSKLIMHSAWLSNYETFFNFFKIIFFQKSFKRRFEFCLKIKC